MGHKMSSRQNRTKDLKMNLEVREGFVSILVNSLVSVTKVFLFSVTGSVAVLADAVHSATDILTSFLVIIGAQMSRKKPDYQHPFGHGQWENVASLIISVILAAAALEFFKTSLERIIHPKEISSSLIFLLLLGATMIVKSVLTLYAFVLFLKSGSSMLRADLWHHLTDVLSTLVVLGGLIFSGMGMQSADGWAGCMVSLMILYVAWDIARRAISPLLGQPPEADFLEAIKKKTRGVDRRIYNVHDIVVHHYGSARVVSLHAELPAELSFRSAHNIAEEVSEVLGRDLHGDFVVHPDPVNRKHPCFKSVEKYLSLSIKRQQNLLSFHDLRIIGGSLRFNILFELHMRADLDVRKRKEEIRLVSERLKKKFPRVRYIKVKDEPIHHYA